MENRRPRSFFWPILLIGIGILWLLSNMGFISGVTFGTIFRFWPLILIVIGLDLIVGRFSGILSAVIAILAVLILAALLVAAPSLGLHSSANANVETFSAPLAEAEFAEVTLDLSSYATTIKTVQNQNSLFDAEIGYYGEMRFTDSGTTNRRIRLEHYSSPDSWFNINFDQLALRWDIGLNPDVPTDLFVDGGSGSINMDLSKMALTALTYDGGSGSMDMSLPTSADGYTASLDTGSGSVRVRISGSQNLTLELDGGSGSTNITLPANTAVRIEALDDGSGSLRVPTGLDQIEFGDDRDEGVWQSDGFEAAEYQIIIRIKDAGSGSITIR
ncbi:MAG: hypothetical protein CL609_07335 [Anaerolineaceae bacterium]|nr:hypothetical protein [Anaerolineaceae bacterium]